MADYDSPWKEVLSHYFEAFVELFFPEMYAGIDWSRGYKALDTELQQITPDAEEGRRFVDKLVEVWRIDGEAEWVLIHVEVQGQEESRFARRMFIYNSRIVERYNKPAVSVAVLADENPKWMPRYFRRELWGCSTEFRFPIVKLLGYADRADELEQSGNPFGPFVLAYLKAQEFKRDDSSRYTWKVRLLRGLFERGWQAEEIRNLLRLIDWVIQLPPELAVQCRTEIHRIQEEKQMAYVTSFERLALEEGREVGRDEGRDEGREEGLRQGIAAVLDVRFGEAGARLMPEIEAIDNADLLRTILDRSRTAPSPDHLRECWKEK